MSDSHLVVFAWNSVSVGVRSQWSRVGAGSMSQWDSSRVPFKLGCILRPLCARMMSAILALQKLSDLLVGADLTLFNRACLSAVWSLGFGHILISIKGCYHSECYLPVSMPRSSAVCRPVRPKKHGLDALEDSSQCGQVPIFFFFFLAEGKEGWGGKEWRVKMKKTCVMKGGVRVWIPESNSDLIRSLNGILSTCNR